MMDRWQQAKYFFGIQLLSVALILVNTCWPIFFEGGTKHLGRKIDFSGTVAPRAKIPALVAWTLHKKLNINNALEHELVIFPGIGKKLAKKILDHRQKQRGFKKWKELLEIPGIGPKKLNQLHSYFLIE